MVQVPAAQTFMQQVEPYLVVFVIGALGALGLIVQAYAKKLVAQLVANHAATAEAAEAANTAAQAVTAHSAQASAQLDSIEGKVNGAMSALQAKSDTAAAGILAAKDAQIEALKAALPKVS